MTDFQIPDSVVTAAAKALYTAGTKWGRTPWERLPERVAINVRAEARAALQAALKEWGVETVQHSERELRKYVTPWEPIK